MYQRFLQLSEIAKTKSFFLIGPRQTGKSTLLRATFLDATYIDLLEADTFRRLNAFPESIREMIKPGQKMVIIDEIQKIPSLLDEVQRLIDRDKSIRFGLTGSSARKLKRGNANLLGGRALYCHLHPLVSCELNNPNVLARLNRGSLPSMIDNEHYQRDLGAYVGVYLREEIQSEGLTRSIGNFGRVLEMAAQYNGQQVNFTQLGSDAQVPPRTVRDYFQLFEDTLIGAILPTFRETKTRKAVSTPKFYFFDVGVARVLRREGEIASGSRGFGDALEHLVFLELKAYLDYTFSNARLSYWRSQSKFEVDFLIDDKIAIEVKGTNRVSGGDLKGIKALAEEVSLKRKIVVSSEPAPRYIEGIEIMHFDAFFKALWSHEIIGG